MHEQPSSGDGIPAAWQRDDNRRRRALEHAEELTEAWRVYRAEKHQLFQVAAVHDRAEKLIDFLLYAFPGEPSATAETRAIVSSTENFLHADILDKVPDEMVPFAVVMSVVRHHRVMLMPSQVKNWSTLMKRYNFLSA